MTKKLFRSDIDRICILLAFLTINLYYHGFSVLLHVGYAIGISVITRLIWLFILRDQLAKKDLFVFYAPLMIAQLFHPFVPYYVTASMTLASVSLYSLQRKNILLHPISIPVLFGVAIGGYQKIGVVPFGTSDTLQTAFSMTSKNLVSFAITDDFLLGDFADTMLSIPLLMIVAFLIVLYREDIAHFVLIGLLCAGLFAFYLNPNMIFQAYLPLSSGIILLFFLCDVRIFDVLKFSESKKTFSFIRYILEFIVGLLMIFSYGIIRNLFDLDSFISINIVVTLLTAFIFGIGCISNIITRTKVE